MNDAGYTLVEMLAALAILGLAMGGLAEGMAAIGRAQSGATSLLMTQRSWARANRDLSRLFQEQGPFQSGETPSLKGDATNLSFPCGAQKCSARLIGRKGDPVLEVSGADGWRDAVALPGQSGAHFSYVDEEEQHPAWPPPGDHGRRKVRSVMVLTGQSAAPSSVAGARLWIEQPPDCAYDMIIADCRARGP